MVWDEVHRGDELHEGMKLECGAVHREDEVHEESGFGVRCST